MAAIKQGVVCSFRRLSPVLAILRLHPEPGSRFPGYQPGQYMALRREDCQLTRRILDAAGRPRYVPELDASGHARRGPVTHSYSIGSAPFETARDGQLEFYLVLEQDDQGTPGRLTGSLFGLDPTQGEQVGYYDRIAGDFTLERRAAGFRDVCLVGTGTGVAPFVSMLKQLHHEAASGRVPPARYTLFYANRSRAELAYHEELDAIAAGGRFDFLYVPALSRPTAEDANDPGIGRGRANNLLRSVLDQPLREEEDLDAAAGMGDDVEEAEAALQRTVMPVLPARLTKEQVRERLDPARSVILSCGNPSSMADVRHVAEVHGMRFEKEDWKPAARG